MFRYLSAAFWARPRIWGLGWIPWNALAVPRATVAGFADHAIWIAGGGIETFYLFVLATNPGFQRWVQESAITRLTGESDESRAALVATLGGAARQRLIRLDEKVTRIEKLYDD